MNEFGVNLLYLKAPVAMVTESTVGIAIGTPPTITTSAFSKGGHSPTEVQGALRPTKSTRSMTVTAIIIKIMQNQPISLSIRYT